MDIFIAANLGGAVIAMIVLALAPARVFKALAIALGIGAAGFFLWAVYFGNTCVSDGCIGVILPGMLCAACAVAVLGGWLIRLMIARGRSAARTGRD